MPAAVIYARHSPSNTVRRAAQKAAVGDPDKTNSAERQVEVCRRYLEMRGYELAHDPFVDEDRSGKDAMEDRPGASAMLAFLRKRPQPATIVVMTELDRGWRDPKDALATAEAWTKAGIAIHFAAMGGNSIDTSTPIGEYVFGQLALFARLQRRVIGERTKRRMRSNQANGRRMSHVLPYGYKLDPDSERKIIRDPKTGDAIGEGELTGLIPSPGEQIVVRQIIEMRQNGCGIGEIRRALHAGGELCRGKPWRHDTLRKIIERGTAKE